MAARRASFSPAPPPRLGPASATLTPRAREILDALEELVVREGFSRFTVSDLTVRLKCSRRALYALAPTRPDLVLVVLDRRMRRLGRLVREATAGVADPLARLHTLLTLEAEALTSTSAAFRTDVQQAPTVAALLAQHRRWGSYLIHQTLVDGISSGRFRRLDPAAVVLFIDAALDRLEDPEFAEDGTPGWSTYVLELSRFVEAGVLTPLSSDGMVGKKA